MTPSISGASSAAGSAVKTSDLFSSKPSTPASNRPATLPAETGSAATDKVSLSDEAKKLGAAKAVTSAPVATAAVSNDPQVDKVATTVYSAQQAQNLADIYQDTSRSAKETQSSTVNESA